MSKTQDIRVKYKRRVKDAIFIMCGVLMASIGLQGFLLPNGFLDGGAMGFALLVKIKTGIDLSYLIILINLPFIVIGARSISIDFAVKSSLAIVSLAILVHVIHIPVFTNDKLLISVFGGFFLGAGIGLSVRGGAVIDGTEVLAVNVSRKSSLTVGDFIALLNLLLFSLSAFLVNIETAMYSMLTYISASKTVDFIINGIEEYIGVTIVSPMAEDIRRVITEELGRGVTVYNTESGFGNTDSREVKRKVLFCVVTRLEVSELITEIEKIDTQAFVVQHPIKDTRGGMIKKRPLH